MTWPRADATRAEVDRFLGEERPQPMPTSRVVIRVWPLAQWVAALHHTIDEFDALEADRAN
jgi:hypothetical protein